MKIILGLILMCFLLKGLNAQTDEQMLKKSLQSEGIVKSIKVEQQKSNRLIRISLRVQLTNTGLMPIILWNQKERPDGFKGIDLIRTRLILSRRQQVSKEDTISDYLGGVSISGDPAWQQVRKKLNQVSPPPKLTSIIFPNQMLAFDTETTVICAPKNNENTSTYPTLEELQTLGTIWLHLCYETWSFNLEPNPRKSESLIFGRALQKKWKKFGNLRLEDFCTEPIQIDLK